MDLSSKPDVQLVTELTTSTTTFTYKGVFFLVISTQARSGVSEELIRWMRDSLSKATSTSPPCVELSPSA